MLVVLAVLGLVTALAAPALRDTTGERALDRTAREIALLLREARAEALSSGSDTLVFVDLEESRISPTWRGDSVRVPEDIATGVITAREELVPTGRPALRFFGDGSATGGAIRLTAQDVEMLISVDWLTGRVERTITAP
jgi:general secretion pathway protein H